MSAFAPPHILVLEPDGRGHAHEWIRHLLEYCGTSRQPIMLSLAVSPDLMLRLADVPAMNGALTTRLMPLDRREVALCNHRVLAVSGMARWWIMRKYLARSRARHGIFLSIDHASLPLACGLSFGGRTVSGILFRPSVHYGQIGDYKPDWKERLRDLRKAFLYRRMLKNEALRSIQSLDPYFPQYARTQYECGPKVTPVPDPANPVIPITWEDAKVAKRLPENRARFLLFGDLTRRKGIVVLLDALSRLQPEIASKVAIVIAGRTDDDLKAYVMRKIESLARRLPELWIQYEGRFLNQGEIAALVSRCDVVLAPYQRFVGSSGVLMWAAREGKPIITQDYGLLGRLAREHCLGLAIDTTDPTALADAIGHVVEDGVHSLSNRTKIETFVYSRTPDRFAGAIIAGALAPVASNVKLGGAVSMGTAVPK